MSVVLSNIWYFMVRVSVWTLSTLDIKPRTTSIWVSKSYLSFLTESLTLSTALVIARVTTISNWSCCLARANEIATSMLTLVPVELSASCCLRLAGGILVGEWNNFFWLDILYGSHYIKYNTPEVLEIKLTVKIGISHRGSRIFRPLRLPVTLPLFKLILKNLCPCNFPTDAGRASVSIYSVSAPVGNVICATVRKRVGCSFKYGGCGFVKQDPCRTLLCGTDINCQTN